METLTISLKETFRKGIANSKIQSVCQFGDADYLICTKNQVFHYSAFKDSGNNLSKLNFAFKTSIFIKDLNIICAIGSSLPNIIFLSTRSGFPLICEAYRLSSSLYDTIQYSPKNKKLIVSGDSVEIFDIIIEWKLFEIDPMITLVNKLSFSCERMTSNVFLDEMRQILIIPSLFGISTVDMTNLKGSPNHNLERAVSHYQLGYIPFQTMAFYNSTKLSKQRSISNIPFKYLITTNSNGDISLWNSSSIKTSHPIHNFKKLNEVSILCEFIDNEFCLFVTENRPNYFVILFDVKTGKTIKLTSFDTKVIKMNVLSKKSVSFLTEDFYVVYQINIPWHFFSKTASNAVAIRRYPTFSTHQKAARVATLFDDGIVSLFSPDVHFLLTEIGTTCSCKIIDFIYDRSSSLRIRDKIVSIENMNEKIFYFQNQSNLDLNANLATSNFEQNRTVSFNFTANLQESPNNNQIESSPKSVNFCPSIIQLRKRQQIRKYTEIGERFIFLLDNGTIQVFNSNNDHFILSKTVDTANLISLALTYIRDENEPENEDECTNYEPVFIGFNKEGELLSFCFDNFDVLTRTAVTTNVSKGRQCPLFVCLHHRTNSIYAVYDNQILIIDSSTKKVIQTEHLNSKPRFASLEDDLFLIVYENRTIQLRHLNDSQNQEQIKILENVTYAIVQYETYIIVTDDKTVRIGHTFDNCAIFEFPFKIFSAGFINPELDVALGLDFEVMVIRRSLWYPFINKPFNCTSDSSDPKTEKIITTIHDKAVLYNIKEEEENSKEALDSENSSNNDSDYYSTSSSSSSSLSQNTCNSLFLMSKTTNKSATSFVHNSNKIITHHKSTPNIVKLKPYQSIGNETTSNETSTLINRRKKLPELRSNEEMMNDKQFMALFKDVGSGLNEGNKRKQNIFTSKKNSTINDDDPEEKENIDIKSKANNNNNKNKQPKAKKDKDAGENDIDLEKQQKKRIKKKKKVAQKNSDDDNDNENQNILDLLKMKQNSLIEQTSSNISLNTQTSSNFSLNTQNRSDISLNTQNSSNFSLNTQNRSDISLNTSQNEKEKSHIHPKPPTEPLNQSIHPRTQNTNKKEEKSAPNSTNNSNFNENDQINTNTENDSINQNIIHETKTIDKDNITEENEFYADESDTNNDTEETNTTKDESISDIEQKGATNESNQIDTNNQTNNNNDKDQSSFIENSSNFNIGSQNDKIDADLHHNEENESKKTKNHRMQTTTLTNHHSKAQNFMKLGAKNKLTMSSPDLILLQAHLCKVKLTVENGNKNNNNNNNSTEFNENKKILPLITVHVIQKKISRTKSEYNLVRSVDQSIFNIENRNIIKVESGTIGLQIQRMMKTKNQEIDRNNINYHVQQEKKSNELFSIKPLFPSEKQPKRKGPRNNKRLDYIIPKRTDRQPLGNVELAIQVFRPNGKK